MADISNDCKPYSVDKLNALNLEYITLAILNTNCQSIRNKFLHFESFISSLTINFHIIVMTKTWLFNNELLYIKLGNYSFIGTQRPYKEGGIGAFGWDGC